MFVIQIYNNNISFLHLWTILLIKSQKSKHVGARVFVMAALVPVIADF